VGALVDTSFQRSEAGGALSQQPCLRRHGAQHLGLLGCTSSLLDRSRSTGVMAVTTSAPSLSAAVVSPASKARQGEAESEPLPSPLLTQSNPLLPELQPEHTRQAKTGRGFGPGYIANSSHPHPQKKGGAPSRPPIKDSGASTTTYVNINAKDKASTTRREDKRWNGVQESKEAPPLLETTLRVPKDPPMLTGPLRCLQPPPSLSHTHSSVECLQLPVCQGCSLLSSHPSTPSEGSLVELADERGERSWGASWRLYPDNPAGLCRSLLP
jgi:hypothetical protein